MTRATSAGPIFFIARYKHVSSCPDGGRRILYWTGDLRKGDLGWVPERAEALIYEALDWDWAIHMTCSLARYVPKGEAICLEELRRRAHLRFPGSAGAPKVTLWGKGWRHP